MNSKLINDLPDLVKNGVISEAVASNIRQYYQSKETDSPNKLFMVFGVLGSLLVGLGIILILAHNWDDFSRSIKTVFAFLPLLIGQLITGFSILKKKSAVWKEASGTFLFFAVGSSIALVSQIYNIPGDLSSFLLTWTLLCFPLVYILKSNALAILHVVFSTYYAYTYGYTSFEHTPWLYLILIALVIPYYYQLLKHHPHGNITSLFNWLLPLSLVIVLGAFIDQSESLGFLMYVLLFGLFYNIGKIPFFDEQKLRRNGYVILGSVGTISLLLITSFNWLWDFGIDEFSIYTQEFCIAVILFLSSVAVLGYCFSKGLVKNFSLLQVVFVLFTLLFFIRFQNDWVTTIMINLLILALGIVTIKIGTDKFHFGILNYGLIIVTALLVCRFFDTDMSYIIRGLLFVGVGIGFFFTNYLMLKKKKSLKTEL